MVSCLSWFVVCCLIFVFGVWYESFVVNWLLIVDVCCLMFVVVVWCLLFVSLFGVRRQRCVVCCMLSVVCWLLVVV